MGRRKLSHRIGPVLARLLGPAVVRGLAATWRVRFDPPDFVGRMAEGDPRVYALWHANLLSPAAVVPGAGAAVMVSRHADGESIARVVERLGYTTVRGSSTRGGAAALLDAVEALRSGRHSIFTPDGPKGPREVARPGAVFAASRAGTEIVPTGVGVRRAWTLRSWDRFRIPKPFTTVAIVEGERLRPPAELGDEALEEWRARLEAALKDADARAQRLAEGAAP
jgi:lysophospholipid acyltransferase (LPLAT)-like uncharacterized protein